jgi:serine/threonine-protein kinase
LRKEPDERWQTAADLKDVLEWLAEEGFEAKPGSTKGARFPRVVAASIAVASFMGILVWILGRDVSQASPVTRTEIPLASGEVFPYHAPSITISADGRRIAYVGQSGNDLRIFVRELDRMEPRPVAGTEGGVGPFFSPDGEWLGFFAEGELKKVSLRGGATVTL